MEIWPAELGGQLLTFRNLILVRGDTALGRFERTLNSSTVVSSFHRL